MNCFKSLSELQEIFGLLCEATDTQPFIWTLVGQGVQVCQQDTTWACWLREQLWNLYKAEYSESLLKAILVHVYGRGVGLFEKAGPFI